MPLNLSYMGIYTSIVLLQTLQNNKSNHQPKMRETTKATLLSLASSILYTHYTFRFVVDYFIEILIA